MTIKDFYDRKEHFLNTNVVVFGWVRFNRVSKNIGFIEIFDGSNLKGIQLVYKATNLEIYEALSKVTNFSAIRISGLLIQGKGEIEIEVNNIIDIKLAIENYSLGKKEHGLEFLRDIASSRSRTKLFQSIMKIRSLAFISIHDFFSKENWLNISTPIITSNDAEGAGESFQLRTSNNQPFFTQDPKLTVSGQLHAESYAQSFSKVYTFGPTFRAENSNTTKHASEFLMLEPEATWMDYFEMMELIMNLISFVIKKVWNSCSEEIDFLEKYNKKDLITTYKTMSLNKFKKISYKDAIEVLNKAIKEGHVFENNNISFGIDFSTEHERYLAEIYANGPIFVFDYPAKIKAFYMYQNNDQTVRGFDLLIPGIGELIGGSQREDRYDFLLKAVKDKNINIENLKWYIDLRQEGYAPSSGFGLGFERLIMFLTGMENIRDVIPFPRTPGKLLF